MSSPAARLRKLLARPGPVLLPGAYDGLVARVMEAEGFEGLFISGNAVSTAIGHVDLGLTTMTESVDRARQICDAVEIPVVIDADTGFGGPLNVQRTIRELERVGIAGVMVEDQTFPKRCGMLDGKEVVPQAEAVARVRAAVDGRRDPDTIIIARTDARAVEGLDSAIARGRAFAEAGADIVFIEGPETLDEMRRCAAEISVPLLANDRVEGRYLTLDDVEAVGHKLLTVVGAVTSAVFTSTREVARHLRRAGGMTGYEGLKLASRSDIDAVTDIHQKLELSLRYES